MGVSILGRIFDMVYLFFQAGEYSNLKSRDRLGNIKRMQGGLGLERLTNKSLMGKLNLWSESQSMRWGDSSEKKMSELFLLR